ncbi:hypothetical protein KHA80_17030 [Anaerobacillus sp. HL2]|nr:hypothetical protein KHA80_17030 [Anaerobacillus sp. HL2]
MNGYYIIFAKRKEFVWHQLRVLPTGTSAKTVKTTVINKTSNKAEPSFSMNHSLSLLKSGRYLALVCFVYFELNHQ